MPSDTTKEALGHHKTGTCQRCSPLLHRQSARQLVRFAQGVGYSEIVGSLGGTHQLDDSRNTLVDGKRCFLQAICHGTTISHVCLDPAIGKDTALASPKHEARRKPYWPEDT